SSPGATITMEPAGWTKAGGRTYSGIGASMALYYRTTASTDTTVTPTATIGISAFHAWTCVMAEFSGLGQPPYDNQGSGGSVDASMNCTGPSVAASAGRKMFVTAASVSSKQTFSSSDNLADTIGRSSSATGLAYVFEDSSSGPVTKAGAKLTSGTNASGV